MDFSIKDMVEDELEVVANDDLNNVLNHFAIHVANKAIKLTILQEKKTISAREIQGAIRLLSNTSNIVKMMVVFGTKAVVRFNAGSHKKGKSRSYNSGIVFSVNKVENIIREQASGKLNLGVSASIYLAACMQYLLEIMVWDLNGKDLIDIVSQNGDLEHLMVKIKFKQFGPYENVDDRYYMPSKKFHREIEEEMRLWLDEIMYEIILYTEMDRRITIMVRDVLPAIYDRKNYFSSKFKKYIDRELDTFEIEFQISKTLFKKIVKDVSKNYKVGLKFQKEALDLIHKATEDYLYN